MAKKWGAPRIMVQEFEANEYVAACWAVGCDWNAANAYEQKNQYWDNGNVSHAAGGHCGDSGNQVIKDINDDNVADTMTEVGTDGLGDLACIIYTDASYRNERPIGEVRPGNYIYWTTSSGSRTWHHQGWVSETVPGHPNRS